MTDGKRRHSSITVERTEETSVNVMYNKHLKVAKTICVNEVTNLICY